MVRIVVVAAIVIVPLACFWIYRGAVAEVAFSRNELNACAVMVARRDYRREWDWGTKTWNPDVRTQEDADQSLIVDSGLRPDLIRERDKYRARFGAYGPRTVYDRYVDEGAKLCLAMKLRGDVISMPTLKVAQGYHVTRSNGGAALVKDGEPEPTFGCIDGYHFDGTECVKD